MRPDQPGNSDGNGTNPAENGRPTGNQAHDAHRWSDCIFELSVPAFTVNRPHLLGVLEGEGVGPTVVGAALGVLSALQSVTGRSFEIECGGAIGLAAEACSGASLSDEVAAFCANIFARGGAILAGAGGGRFVYDLRQQFDLFCKLSPLRVCDELIAAGRLKPQHVRGVDILVVRENIAGVYRGLSRECHAPAEGLRVEHAFHYTEAEVCRIVDVAARIAAMRRGELLVVVKDGGLPALSGLWRRCASEAASQTGVRCSFANVDYAAYRLIQDAPALDVIVAPNLFGDVLADVGSLLLGSRGLSYSGNFSSSGAAVYQTNHGAAYDLVGTDQANPVGQIHSLAMLLRESFGLAQEAALVEAAVAEVWRQGWRTADLREDGQQPVGTREMAERIADALVRRASLAHHSFGQTTAGGYPG